MSFYHPMKDYFLVSELATPTTVSGWATIYKTKRFFSKGEYIYLLNRCSKTVFQFSPDLIQNITFTSWTTSFANARDYDDSTYASSPNLASSTTPYTLLVADLGAVYSDVLLVLKTGTVNSTDWVNYIDTSTDNVNFTNVWSASGNGAINTYLIELTNVRYIRWRLLNKTGYTYSFSCYTFEAWNIPSVVPTVIQGVDDVVALVVYGYNGSCGLYRKMMIGW